MEKSKELGVTLQIPYEPTFVTALIDNSPLLEASQHPVLIFLGRGSLLEQAIREVKE